MRRRHDGITLPRRRVVDVDHWIIIASWLVTVCCALVIYARLGGR